MNLRLPPCGLRTRLIAGAVVSMAVVLGGGVGPAVAAVAWAGMGAPAGATSITVPGSSVPGVTVTVPGVTVPGVTVPGVTVPAVSVPAVSVPALEVPGVVQMPAVTLPQIPTGPATGPEAPLDGVTTSVPRTGPASGGGGGTTAPAVGPSTSPAGPATRSTGSLTAEAANLAAVPTAQALGGAALRSARDFTLPFALAVLVVLYLLVGARGRWGDPSLTHAPLTDDDDLLSFS